MTQDRQENGTALVTGGAKRIGAAIARDLAAHGFAVAVHYNRSPDAAEALVASIRADGGTAQAVGADLADAAATTGLIDAAAAALGPVTLLVNNASVFEDDCVTDFDLEQFERHFAVHLKAPSLLARAMAGQLPATASGLIVNMIDQRVLSLTPRFYSYTLSKSALWTATRTMAQALAPRIRVNAIGPGPTLPNERQTQADFDRQVEGLILQRGPGLEEFGATVRWMWQTPSFTGQIVALDGGQHLAWETPDVAGIEE
ncbi:short chain dehydrogenase [Zhengella mangrovi]|uniref:Short chain dehydrogenase n=1 Tax=Zhengella mangrovi TaxID=1982044 RepID=A0A2G1QRZ4_9HYPH|nr:SDR family oxidoreductase [Zhengella mangrovi]PHP68224.1 short chain dehydrogenase [Zhengella mangrovi]